VGKRRVGVVVEPEKNFDRADEILQDYYKPDERKPNLIADEFNLLGE
jgi:hypothetical protein